MLTKDVYLKPLIVVMMLMFLQQFSGINAVLFYTQTIFEDAGSDIAPGKRTANLPQTYRKLTANLPQTYRKLWVN